jgi:sterol desaturase/sphingolipid hydroxylase (fatty acid hydroxylase superfamily)
VADEFWPGSNQFDSASARADFRALGVGVGAAQWHRPVEFAGWFLVASGCDYHHCHSETPWLWRVHRVHHFDNVVDVSTGLRNHPVELLPVVLINASVAIMFGLLPWALITYGTAEALFALYSHANIRFPTSLDRTLRLVLVTPRIHAVHHSAHKPETDSNYGGVFTIWDRLFGTYCDLRADCPEKMQFGLAELRDQRVSDLWWQLKSPAYPVTKSTSGLSARPEASL